MKTLIVAATALAVLLGGIDLAAAKTYRDSGGGSGHRGSGVTHPRIAKPRAKSTKPKSALVVVKCKTKACLKKHPSGVYAFKPKPKTPQ